MVTLSVGQGSSGEEAGHTCDYSVAMTKGSAQALAAGILVHILEDKSIRSKRSLAAKVYSGMAQLRQEGIIQAAVGYWTGKHL